MRFQAWHFIVLIIVILLVFGSAKLPDMASSLGKSLKIFKKEVSELREDTAIPGVTTPPVAAPPAAPPATAPQAFPQAQAVPPPPAVPTANPPTDVTDQHR